MSIKSKVWLVVGVVLVVLLGDQFFKFWIKTNMYLGQEFNVLGNWFKIHFTENEGMAFGMAFGGRVGKLILTLFRITAVVFIGYLFVRFAKQNSHWGFLLAMGLIFAGALGNIIDSVFYGMIFSESSFQMAEFLPQQGGYESMFHGKVVDMLYFPLYEGYLPNWLPLWGGDYFIFFRPVFNIADSAITTGVIIMIIWQKTFFKEAEPK